MLLYTLGANKDGTSKLISIERVTSFEIVFITHQLLNMHLVEVAKKQIISHSSHVWRTHQPREHEFVRKHLPYPQHYIPS